MLPGSLSLGLFRSGGRSGPFGLNGFYARRNNNELWPPTLENCRKPLQLLDLVNSSNVKPKGARLSDITTQRHTFPRHVRPEMRLVHVHRDPAVIGTHFAADLAIASDPKTLIDSLVKNPAATTENRQSWVERLGEQRRGICQPRFADVDDGLPFDPHVVR